jgi:sugar lactone lactonase YvrE
MFKCKNPASLYLLNKALCKVALPLLAALLFFSQARAQQVLSTDSPADLIPESITFSRQTGLYYVSSIHRHKIVTIDGKGHCTDFLASDKYGYLEGLGLKADDKHGILWGVSNFHTGPHYRSLVQAFDLHTHALVYSAVLEDTVPHLFNDLVLAGNEKVYITDTFFGALYMFDPGTKRLSLFRRDQLLFEPNGIAADGQTLYVATSRAGIVCFPLSGGPGFQAQGIVDTAARMIDGLIRIDHALYGVAGATTDTSLICVVEYLLDATGKRAIAEKKIDRNNPAFHTPTGVTFDGQWVVVLADSYLEVYNKNNESTDGLSGTLQPITLLFYPIR